MNGWEGWTCDGCFRRREEKKRKESKPFFARPEEEDAWPS
jgi:hypothetical protein